MAEFGFIERLKMAKSAYTTYRRWMPDGNAFDELGLIIRILGGRYLFIEHFELVVTTFCSLNCKGCSNSMPEYRKRATCYSLDYEYMKNELDKIMACVDRVLDLRILGGEPFLNPAIGDLLKYALTINKINHIDIVSNGTVMPSKDLIEVMSNPKISIMFSDYGEASRNISNIYAELTRNNVKCYKNESLRWSTLGNYSKRKCNETEMAVQMKKCPFICKTYLKGNLHRCPRSAFGTDLGYYDYSDEYIKINEEQVRETRREIVRILYKIKYLKCCAHCLAATDYSQPLSPGEQI